jgi:hypothetical protein
VSEFSGIRGRSCVEIYVMKFVLPSNRGQKCPNIPIKVILVYKKPTNDGRTGAPDRCL